jgi:hypothetical protein
MIDAEPSRSLMDAPPSLRRTAADQKNVRAPWANGKLSLMLTMAFLEFRLNGFKTASKPCAPQQNGRWQPRWRLHYL